MVVKWKSVFPNVLVNVLTLGIVGTEVQHQVDFCQ